MDKPSSIDHSFGIALPPRWITLARAFLLSCLVLGFLVALVAVVVVPGSRDQLYDMEETSITHAVINEAADQALVVFRIMPHSPLGATYHLGVHRLQQDLFAPRIIHAIKSPSCVVATPKGTVIGFADGTLRQFSSAWTKTDETLINSELVGQQSGGAPLSLACSTDGRHLISYDSDSIYVWDLSGKKLKQRLPRGESYSFVWAPHGDTFYHDLQGNIVERSAATGEELRTLDRPREHVVALALSLDGRHLAALGLNGELCMLDTASGRRLWQREVSSGPGQHSAADEVALPALSSALAFNATGQLASASDHGSCGQTWSITLWDVHTGQRQARFAAHRDLILGIAFGTERRCYSWSADGTLRAWDLPAFRSDSSAMISHIGQLHP